MTERNLAFSGFEYRCRIVGQNEPRTEPIVILGGSSQDRYSWTRHERWLAAVSTVITVDLPGYGDSDFLPSRYGIDFLAEAVRHMLDETGISRVNLVGACFGGIIGLRFTQHHPELVRRMALVGMTTRIPQDYWDAVPRWWRMIERGEHDTVAAELVAQFMSPSAATKPVRKHGAVSRMLYHQFRSQTRNQIRMAAEHNERLVTHDCYRPDIVPETPSLVFTGESDTLTPPAMGRELATKLPNARFTTVHEADHLLPLERMREFSELVTRFCTDQAIDDLPYCHPVEAPTTGR
nr:alpha/beta hydrolase [Halopolyspora algeriensis]